MPSLLLTKVVGVALKRVEQEMIALSLLFLIFVFFGWETVEPYMRLFEKEKSIKRSAAVYLLAVYDDSGALHSTVIIIYRLAEEKGGGVSSFSVLVSRKESLFSNGIETEITRLIVRWNVEWRLFLRPSSWKKEKRRN